MKTRRKARGLRVELAVASDGRRVLVGRDAKKVDRLLTEAEPYHEAAHAVVALAFGLDVSLVTVADGEAGRLSGDKTMTGGTMRKYTEDPHLNAVVAIAGVLWDTERTGMPFELVKLQAHSDVARVNHFAPSSADRRRATERALTLLNEQHEAIVVVGRALAEKRRAHGR